MNSSKLKTLVIVTALLLVTSIITVGCKSKAPEAGWVNTGSLPGQTFTRGANKGKHSNSGVIYLGSSSSSSDANFGPKDINFDVPMSR